VRTTGKFVFSSLGLLLLAAITAEAWAERPDPGRWESAVAAFEAGDRESPPPANAIVFIGSSSIRFWNSVHEDMAPLTVIHRGFGGSWMSDAVHYADRLVNRYEPRAVVLYEGDNDISEDLAPEALLEDFRAFVARVHADLPRARVYFISIKPSLLRWDPWGAMQAANALIRAETEIDPRLRYLDVATPMLGADGSAPAESLFVADRLHMTPAGYEIWTAAIRPLLLAEEGDYE
jgi:lysophospholipase L1-like esterase